MRRWQVGEVEVVRIEDDDFALPSDRTVPEWAVPHLAPDTSSYFVAFSAFAIADGDRRIVVDPWLANDAVHDRPDAAARADRLVGALTDAGFPADEVDTVVNTHLDGTGWNSRPGSDDWVPTFPNARYLWARAELEALDRGEELVEGHDLSVLRTAGLVDAVDVPHQVSDAVHLVDAPGHNFGHVTVRVESGGELAMIPGHLFVTILSVVDWTPLEGEGAESRASREAVLAELADRRGLLLSPLFGGAGGGAVERDGEGYRVVSP